MSQQSPGSKGVIIAALIGLFGTIITAISAISIEAMRQQAESTRTALLLIGTQSVATQTSLASTISALSTMSAPSAPGKSSPTNTYGPPTATFPPTLWPSPTPDTRLFWDDFSTLPKPEWHMEGVNFSIVNHQLVADGGSFAGYVGDSSWTNYAVILKNISIPLKSTGFSSRYIDIPIRMADKSNAVVFRAWLAWAGNGVSEYQWLIIKNGEEIKVPGADGSFKAFENPVVIRLEVNRAQYVATINGSVGKPFSDGTFTSGGTGIHAVDFVFSLDEFSVEALP